MAKCRVPAVHRPAQFRAWRGLPSVRQWFSTKLRWPTREEWLLPLPRAGGRTEIRRLTSAEALTRHVKTWVLRGPVRERGTEAWLAGNKRRDQSLPFCGAGSSVRSDNGIARSKTGRFRFHPAHATRARGTRRGPSSFAVRIVRRTAQCLAAVSPAAGRGASHADGGGMMKSCLPGLLPGGSRSGILWLTAGRLLRYAAIEYTSSSVRLV